MKKYYARVQLWLNTLIESARKAPILKCIIIANKTRGVKLESELNALFIGAGCLQNWQKLAKTILHCPSSTMQSHCQVLYWNLTIFLCTFTLYFSLAASTNIIECFFSTMHYYASIMQSHIFALWYHCFRSIATPLLCTSTTEQHVYCYNNVSAR